MLLGTSLFKAPSSATRCAAVWRPEAKAIPTRREQSLRQHLWIDMVKWPLVSKGLIGCVPERHGHPAPDSSMCRRRYPLPNKTVATVFNLGGCAINSFSPHS